MQLTNYSSLSTNADELVDLSPRGQDDIRKKMQEHSTKFDTHVSGKEDQEIMEFYFDPEQYFSSEKDSLLEPIDLQLAANAVYKMNKKMFDDGDVDQEVFYAKLSLLKKYIQDIVANEKSTGYIDDAANAVLVPLLDKLLEISQKQNEELSNAQDKVDTVATNTGGSIENLLGTRFSAANTIKDFLVKNGLEGESILGDKTYVHEIKGEIEDIKIIYNPTEQSIRTETLNGVSKEETNTYISEFKFGADDSEDIKVSQGTIHYSGTPVDRGDITDSKQVEEWLNEVQTLLDKRK